MIKFMPLFIKGLIKMWWIFAAIFLGLAGTSIVEGRDKRARSKTQRISK